ncbi:DUF1707 domain-containing protein [Herbidospora galbida]|uniref:DUF1707 domain-containing protein n=1 Tax=Herbidospora galbida TaxID=2575442 RepID=A0A4U3MJP2_9ACTN|nr:DUF1707 domain-containing protein [Herbidospora galbida]TKK89591.1 DUF1707 domain-containing protein [Herbidospora galbida]
MRVSDAERDRACAVLREHYAVGRLDDRELSTRLAAAQTAVTWGDLNELMRDLPPIPGMPLMPSAVPYAAPPPPPVAYAPPVHPPQRNRDVGKAYTVAAWVTFILGFASFGLMWIPALIFAVLGRRARERGRDDHNTGTVITIVTGAALLLTLVGVPAAFDDGDESSASDHSEYAAEQYGESDDEGIHEVVMWVAGDRPDATAGDLVMNAEGSEVVSGKGMVLPFEKELDLASLDDLLVEAEAADGAKLTCHITIDGEVVATGKPDPGSGGCTAAYSG